MAAIFDALPGQDVPVGSIGQGLSSMWEDTAKHGGAAPASDDAKATQVNFVLHLGFDSAPDDAQAQFQTAVRFSRRYPCRVVVLCPLAEGVDAPALKAKIYGECTLGKSPDDTRCCEFVMLSYPGNLRKFLENQVSICLSTDLPLYYWPHGFATNARLADYQYLLTRSRRVLIDSTVAPSDALTYPWPKPEAVRDLAYARLLPARQSIGQFLSRYPAPTLGEGLRSVSLEHGSARRGEAGVLLRWLRERLERCGGGGARFDLAAASGAAPESLRLAFAYDGRKSFSWEADLKEGHACFQADLGSGRTSLRAAVGLLAPENALSEAMFF